MRTTERFRTLVGIGILFLILGVVSQRLTPLLAAIGVGAWLITAAGVATVGFRAVDRGLGVSLTANPETILINGEVTMQLTASRDQRERFASAPDVTVTADLPPSIHSPKESLETELSNGEQTASTTATVEPQVAGEITFDPPLVSLSGPFGLFIEQIHTGDVPTLHVQAQTPQEMHVGRGGTRTAGAFGTHQVDEPGPGIMVRELREYVPSDPANAIDWKATARLGEPYVRVTEGETDRKTVLIVDQRSSMAVGRPGATMATYGVGVALAVVEYANEVNDPLGVWTVGDDGITNAISPRTDPGIYARAREVLSAIDPSTASATTTDPGTFRATDAEQRAAKLETNTSFDEILGAYSASPDPYVRKLAGDPFVETVRRARSQVGENALYVLVTSDTHESSIRESVELLVETNASVLTFLTPTVLFTRDRLTDLDAAYEQYTEFEDLRRSLDELPDVVALEVAPKDRMDAVIQGGVAKRNP